MTTAEAAAGGRLGATALRGWWQRLLHAAAVVGGWALFFWGWYEVSGHPWDTRALWWLIVGSLLILPAVTVGWILHNLGIARRKGPRTGVPAADETYRRDWNGREICADMAALADAQIIVIDIDGDRKVYRGVPYVQRSAAHAARPDLLADDDPRPERRLKAA